MKGYAAEHVFSDADQAALALATAVVEWLPDLHDGDCLRCHEVARIVATVLGWGDDGVKVVDGLYRGPSVVSIQHSWVELRPSVLLDPYVPGGLPPVQLCSASYQTENWARYCPDATGGRDDIRADVVRHYVEAWQAQRAAESTGKVASSGGRTLTELLAALNYFDHHPGGHRYHELYILADQVDYTDEVGDYLMLDIAVPRGVARAVRCAMRLPAVHGGREALRVEMARQLAAERQGKGGKLPCVAILRGIRRKHLDEAGEPQTNLGGVDWNRIFPLEFADGGWRAYTGPHLAWFKAVLLPSEDD